MDYLIGYVYCGFGPLLSNKVTKFHSYKEIAFCSLQDQKRKDMSIEFSRQVTLYIATLPPPLHRSNYMFLHG
jgi:hypothetical protein